MKVIALTLFFIIVMYFQMKNLIKNKDWKELFVYLLLMGVGILYSYGIVLGWKLPNPTIFLNKLYKPFYDYIFENLLAQKGLSENFHLYFSSVGFFIQGLLTSHI
ncbi:hypothetical protein [Iocasia frigidifontis]|uniref:hypothetical protein n=1 Tax=Iocasia fonsfrigidae TaxID=2682810 RepID=UPI001E42AC38|nr:hypothetical protein [Iocasia fonsfrigidae]